MFMIKSLVAAAVAGLGALGTALIDNSVTADEWIGVAAAVVGALGIVYAAPANTARGIDAKAAE